MKNYTIWDHHRDQEMYRSKQPRGPREIRGANDVEDYFYYANHVMMDDALYVRIVLKVMVGSTMVKTIMKMKKTS